MSYEAIRWALNLQGLTPSEKLVLIALADHLNGKTNQLNPSVPRIKLETSLSRCSIMRALASLEGKKAITVVRRVGVSNAYSLAMEKPINGHADPSHHEMGTSLKVRLDQSQGETATSLKVIPPPVSPRDSTSLTMRLDQSHHETRTEKEPGKEPGKEANGALLSPAELRDLYNEQVNANGISQAAYTVSLRDRGKKPWERTLTNCEIAVQKYPERSWWIECVRRACGSWAVSTSKNECALSLDFLVKDSCEKAEKFMSGSYGGVKGSPKREPEKPKEQRYDKKVPEKLMAAFTPKAALPEPPEGTI